MLYMHVVENPTTFNISYLMYSELGKLGVRGLIN